MIDREQPIETQIEAINAQEYHPSWAEQGKAVKIAITKLPEGKWEVGTNYLGDWEKINYLNFCPTQLRFDSAEQALTYATQMADKIEHWPTWRGDDYSLTPEEDASGA